MTAQINAPFNKTFYYYQNHSLLNDSVRFNFFFNKRGEYLRQKGFGISFKLHSAKKNDRTFIPCSIIINCSGSRNRVEDQMNEVISFDNTKHATN